MGYYKFFQIFKFFFYGFTSRRNRKLLKILLFCILIFVILFWASQNIAFAATTDELPYYVNWHYGNFWLLNGTVIYRENVTSGGGYEYISSRVFPVYAGYTYKATWTSSPGLHGLQAYFVSNMDEMLFYNVASDGTASPVGVSGSVIRLASINWQNGWQWTANDDGYVIIGNFTDGGSTYYSNYGFEVITDYDGTSNFTGLHNDLLRIESLLKDYLYGDVESYDVPYKNAIVGLAALNSRFDFQNSSTLYTYYFEVKDGYDYKITFDDVSEDHQGWYLRFGYCSDVPRHNLSLSNVNTLAGARNGKIEFTGDTSQGKYYYINFYTKYIKNVVITSNYNYGREYGLYGGLTDINDQTKQQGEMTRDTITSTQYNESDVSINTSTIDGVSSTATDGLFTTIFNNFNSAATGGVDSISIPLPHNSGNIVLYSNVVSSHLGNLTYLVNAFWLYVFGVYAFKFVNNIIHSIKNGDILNGFKANNEVITTNML